MVDITRMTVSSAFVLTYTTDWTTATLCGQQTSRPVLQSTECYRMFELSGVWIQYVLCFFPPNSRYEDVMHRWRCERTLGIQYCAGVCGRGCQRACAVTLNAESAPIQETTSYVFTLFSFFFIRHWISITHSFWHREPDSENFTVAVGYTASTANLPWIILKV